MEAACLLKSLPSRGLPRASSRLLEFGVAAVAARNAVGVLGHEDPGAALRALLAQAQAGIKACTEAQLFASPAVTLIETTVVLKADKKGAATATV